MKMAEWNIFWKLKFKQHKQNVDYQMQWVKHHETTSLAQKNKENNNEIKQDDERKCY